MNFTQYLLAVALCAVLAAHCSLQLALADSSLYSVMQKLKITPDVLPVSDYVNPIRVELNGNIVKPGDSVPAKNFKDLKMDKIHWDVDNYDAMYTLMLLDLDDRKSGQNRSQTVHNQFTSINIPGNSVMGGQAIVAFDSPSVQCQPSMKHRILMLALHQDQTIDFSDINDIAAPRGPSPKRDIKLGNFIRQHRLNLVAANAFYAVGESNGVCSGAGSSTAAHLVSPILVAMVMAAFALSFSNKPQSRAMLN